MARVPTRKTAVKAEVKKEEVAPVPVKKAAKKAAAKKAVAAVAAPVVAAAQKKVAAVREKKVTPVEAAPAKKAVAKKAAVKKVAATAKVITTVVAKVDAGFGNVLYIRGGGGGLAWEKGVAMQNVAADEWVWQSEAITGEVEVKVLLNDTDWSSGPNSVALAGATLVIEPVF